MLVSPQDRLDSQIRPFRTSSRLATIAHSRAHFPPGVHRKNRYVPTSPMGRTSWGRLAAKQESTNFG